MKSSVWHDRVCLVTGASSGLGVAIAQAFAQRGSKVILTARRAEPLERTAAVIREIGGSVESLPGDVTHQEDVDRLCKTVSERYGRIDMLCNCAGQSTRGEILATSVEDFQQLLDVNFLAAVRMTRAFAPLLLESQGHVVNIGSLASKVAPRFMGGYSASKFALAAYSQQLRLELGPQGL
ncbi:MAG: SDR family oxidoreductase, partial [Pirellulales bacterium]|nr:SDR family oxidoreductase [Pirellulales bacterium]